MILYDTQRSGNAWKVRLLAGFLGVPLQRRTLSIDRGDLRRGRHDRVQQHGFRRDRFGHRRLVSDRHPGRVRQRHVLGRDSDR
jgi:hypothetical protein